MEKKKGASYVLVKSSTDHSPGLCEINVRSGAYKMRVSSVGMDFESDEDMRREISAVLRLSCMTKHVEVSRVRASKDMKKICRKRKAWGSKCL